MMKRIAKSGSRGDNRTTGRRIKAAETNTLIL